MFRDDWRKHAQLKARLVKQRQMMSLMEKEIAIAMGEMVQNHENWVRMWVDTGHIITADDGKIMAFRGIDFDGTLMWLVQHPKKKFGYHSLKTDPFAAIDEAKMAWTERARVRAKWPEVQAHAWALFLGREKVTITRNDAYRSPLCAVGVDSFMKRIGLPQRQTISGRTAALFMLLDKQLGFVINSAIERVGSVDRSTVSTDEGVFVERRV